jgi:hypothetical protein
MYLIANDLLGHDMTILRVVDELKNAILRKEQRS